MRFLNLNFSARGGSAFSGQFSKLLEKIYPQPPVVGLEVGDTFIQLVEFKKGDPVKRAYRLPPGAVEGGQVKDKIVFTAILQEIARSLDAGRKMGVVLTIPSNNVFVQTIDLPPAAIHNLEEAAELNVQMVSPLRRGEFYYDWQKVDKGQAERAPIELLGAFVSRETVSNFADCFEEAGFSLVAVEFTSLSLVRLLSLKKLVQTGKPYLAVETAPEGTTFMLTFGGQLLFHSFHNWAAIEREGGKIGMADFLADLTREANKISNFYLAHWGGLVNDIIFITSGLENELRGAFKEKTILLISPEEMVPATGAAARSILGKKEINLLGTSSLHIFNQNRALTFVSLWRTILAAAFGFLLLLSLGSDLFLRQLAARAGEANTLTTNEPDHKELLALRGKAQKFNELIALVNAARKGNQEIGPVAERVNDLAGVEIKINRLYISSIDAPITLSGTASDERAAIAFKNRLAGEPGVTEVELPISGIASETDGRVSFAINFQYNLTE